MYATFKIALLYFPSLKIRSAGSTVMTSDAYSNYCFLNMISAMTPLPFVKSQNKQLSSQAGLSTSSAIFKP